MKHKSKFVSAALLFCLGVSSLAQARGLLDILAAPLLLPLFIASHAPVIVPVPAVSVAVAAPACAPAPAVVYREPRYQERVIVRGPVYRSTLRPMYVRMPAYRPGWRYGRRGWERDRG